MKRHSRVASYPNIEHLVTLERLDAGVSTSEKDASYET